MKKIININLSGRVIPIEDSAYEKLQAYIESLRRYFANEDGRDEIINDIESRIAELMGEKIRKGADCVTEDDISEIMASMGRPEDFDKEEAEEKTTQSSQQSSQQSTYTYTEPRRRNRLYRDSSDKIIGGVCSGLANYLNVDPSIMRLLFAIITFGGFGFGVVVYLLLWIILPEINLEYYGGKRLYRNPEDKVLGGVASGIAAYFGKDPFVVRLIFTAPLLLNILFSALSWPFFHAGAVFPNIVFGSLTGTFILAYIVLWIVLPEAKSQYQKMEMRGEKVDVNTIRQNVKEGMDQMKDRAKDFGEEVKQSAQKFSAKAKEFANTRGANWGKEVGEAGKRVGVGVGHIIGVLFKAFFLFIAGTIAFALLVVLMGLIFGGVGVWPLKNFVLNGFWQNVFAWGTLLFFIGVPIVAFITWLIRRMMNVRSQKSYLGWMFAGLWTLGWISAAFFVASLVNDFRRTQKIEDGFSINQPANGKMIIKVNEPEVRYSGNFWWMDVDDAGWDISRDTLRMANIKVRIDKSEDSDFHVSVARYSAGSDRDDAISRAKNIRYNVSYTDSVLNLGSGLAISKEDKFRFQRIMINVKMPVGKKIRFDESVDMLHPFNVRLYEKRRWDRNNWDVDWDWDNYFDWETNVDYVMNKDGQLVRTDKPAEKDQKDNSPENNNYRYRNNDKMKLNIQEKEQKLEEEKKKLDGEQKKLEEEKKKLNQPNPASTTKRISMDDKDDEAYSNFNIPGFSLVKIFN
jgi:phage shock protein PspC (stress-responsive transcriptional regulator)